MRLSGTFMYFNGCPLFRGRNNARPTHAAPDGELPDENERPHLRCGVMGATTLIGSYRDTCGRAAALAANGERVLVPKST